MRTRYAFTVWLATAASLAMSQWQAEQGMPLVDLFRAERHDASVINVAGYTSLVRTTNNGTLWDSTKVSLFGVGFPCILYDVHFTGPNTGVASGYMSLGSQYVILRTTNSGSDWSTVYVSTSGPLTRDLRDIEFLSATEGIAVGAGGRIVRTTNGGSMWSGVTSPVSDDLKACEFPSASLGIIVGDERILRSTNGGTSWTAQSFPGTYLKAVSFPTVTTGYAAGDDKALLKTTDGGLSWNAITPHIGDAVDFTGLHFASVDTGYATGGDRIWRTVDGGVHWEWFGCPADMNGIAASATELIAVGDAGALYRSVPGGTGYAPVPYFTAPATACQDSLIQLTNGSAPGLTCTWLLNHVPFASTFHASLTLGQASQTDTVGLVVSNGMLNDTMYQVITVAPTLQISFQANVVNDTLCTGQSTQVQVPASQYATAFRLRRGNTNIGTAQNGNGTTLTFNTGTITHTDTLNILATRTVPGCGTTTDSLYVVIYCGTPDNTLAVTALADTLCLGDSTWITLASSQMGTMYQLKRGTTLIGPAQNGTGVALVFSTGPLLATSTYTIAATHFTGCTTTMAQTVTIILSQPVPFFTLDSWGPTVGMPVNTLNSTAPGVTFLWDFGPTALPPNSTAEEPAGVVFTQAGPVNVVLTATSPQGCVGIDTLPINVLDVLPMEDCDWAQGFQLQGSGAYLGGITYGNNGEVFMFFNNDLARELRVHSGHNDTLTDLMPPTTPYDESLHLVKFNARGVPQWMTKMRHASGQAKLGDVLVDVDGNIYSIFFHGGGDSLLIYSTDGHHIGLIPPTSGSLLRSMVVVSWDPNGMYRWHRTFLELYGVQSVRLRLDGAGHLYACGVDNLVKYVAATGQQVWSKPIPPASNTTDMALGANGEPWVLQPNNVKLLHYDTAGTLLSTATYATAIAVPGISNPGTNVTEMQADQAGGFIISGWFYGRILLGPDTLDELDPQWFNSPDFLVCRFVPGVGITWAREMDLTGNGTFDHRGLMVKGNDVLLFFKLFSAFTAHLPGCPPLNVAAPDAFVIHLDTLGGTPRLDYFPHPGVGFSPITGGSSLWDKSMAWDPSSTRIAICTDMKDTAFFAGDTLLPHPISPYGGALMLALGEPGCMLPSLPSPTATPISYFVPPQLLCPNMSVQFMDASLNGATTWAWQFPGASPNTSSDQHPNVTFPALGTYAVTLETTNANGTGTTYLDSVVVDICTGVRPASLPAPVVAPNPVQDQLRITAGAWAGATYTLQEAAGRTVLSGRLQTVTQVDVVDLTDGLYILFVRAPWGQASTPVVIRR